MQPQFNNEGAVPVGVPGALVLLPLALEDLQLELPLYTGHDPLLLDPLLLIPAILRVVKARSSADQQSWRLFLLLSAYGFPEHH